MDRQPKYPHKDGPVTVIGPECIATEDERVIAWKGENYYSDQQITLALGWLSAEFAARADAWNGNAPDWFPEPPEWIELWKQALVETAPDDPAP